MLPRLVVVAAVALLLAPGASAAGDPCRSIAPVPQYRDWPRIHSRIRQDPRQEAFIRRLVGAMTLEQKVGQMTQAEFPSLHDEAARRYRSEEITRFALGSVLGGGGSTPFADRRAPVRAWLALADELWEAAPVVNVPAPRGRDRGPLAIRIPLLWGEDYVHGTQPTFGSTIYPHNIGLGATRNTCLVRDIAEATARGGRATGMDLTFSPSVAVARDDRWGRTYESFSEDPAVVRALGTAMTEGFMGIERDRRSFRGLMTSSKHYLADGGSTRGIDQGVVEAPQAELINVHAQGYFGTLEAGAQCVMVGFFGTPERGEMAGDRHLLTEVLKVKIGFDGFILSDWNAIAFIPGCTRSSCPQAVLAGIDMFMVPHDWKAFIASTVAQVRSGEIPMARIDDAVTRILRAKVRAGLFRQIRPSRREHAGDEDAIVNRPLARRAVRESLVLLKNDGHVLPLARGKRVLVVGKSADSIANQTGGWTLSWQGGPAPFARDAINANGDFPGGQSILSGLEEALGAANVTHRADAAGVDVSRFDAVIAVIGELPYAEMFGDIATADGNWRDPGNLARRTLEHGVRHPEDRAVLRAVSGRGVPVITVLVSGRALYTNAEINLSDAFVAAWLPGTEGGGIADVLVRRGDGAIDHDFVGRLPFSWPRAACQTEVNVGDAEYHPQFPFGYGLDYRSGGQVGRLDETPGPLEGCTD
jgi:beta-glucosidase